MPSIAISESSHNLNTEPMLRQAQGLAAEIILEGAGGGLALFLFFFYRYVLYGLSFRLTWDDSEFGIYSQLSQPWTSRNSESSHVSQKL